MAILSQKNETIVLIAIVVAVYLVYKKLESPVAEAYQAAVDGTADVIADVIGLDAKEAENAEPAPGRDTPEFKAIVAASDAWHIGGRVDEATWRLALDYNKTNPVMLRAGKAWGYGNFFDYFLKDF